MEGSPERLLQHFRQALRHSPASAFRDWFRAQEELRRQGASSTARAMADELWESLPDLPFESPEARARFLHNVAVFFGSPGPAADLPRARTCFAKALEHFAEHAGDGWRARALHNLATAISNLGATAAEMNEGIDLFAKALEWRTSEREIARAVTLHNLGLARRRLAALEPARAMEHLEAAVEALSEAVEIRKRNALGEGEALSKSELERTQKALASARAPSE